MIMVTLNFIILTMKNKPENEFDLDLVDIQINTFERAVNKTRYVPFSSYCYWLLVRYNEKETIFYPNDLSRFAKIGYNTSYRYFEDLVNLGYANKYYTGNVVYYTLVTNSINPKLKELLPYIKKTLLTKKENKNDKLHKSSFAI